MVRPLDTFRLEQQRCRISFLFAFCQCARQSDHNTNFICLPWSTSTLERATHRTNTSAGFCLPCVCLSIIYSSRRRVSPPARASPRLRRVSVCLITRVVLLSAGCLVPRQSVEKTTGVPPVCSKLQSRLSGDKTLLPQPPETLTSEMQCFHSLGQETASTTEGSHCGRPLAEQYQRKHHSTRKARSSDSGCSTSALGRVISIYDVSFGEQSLAESASAGRQWNGDLLQSTLHGRGATSRQNKTGCIIGASLPEVLACRFSSSPARGTGSQKVEKSHPSQNKQSISAGRVGSFVSGLARETIPVDGPLSFVGSGDVLSSQRVAGSPTARHCTTKSTHDEALVSPHFYQQNQRNQGPKQDFIQDTCVILNTQWMVFPSEARHGAGYRNTHKETPSSFFYPSLYHEVKHSANRLGLEDRVTPYQTWQSGPSIDQAGKFQTLDEVRQRGAWKSMSSVLRYDMSSEFAADYHAFPVRARVESEHIASRLVVFLFGNH